MTTITHFVKDPEGIIDYTVRWTTWLGTDTISTSAWTIPSGIVKVSESNTTVDAIVFLASGTVGQIYGITNRITTAGGRQNDQTLSILVKEK